MKTGLHLGFFHLLSDEGKLNIKHAVNRQDKTTDAQDEFSKTYLFFIYSRNIPRYFKLDFFSTHLFFGRTKLIFFSFFIKDINSSLISRPGSCLFSILFFVPSIFVNTKILYKQKILLFRVPCEEFFLCVILWYSDQIRT